MLDANGERLAKRHDALSLRELRAQGATPKSLRQFHFADVPGMRKVNQNSFKKCL
jgi:glutamyl/glutaminyl-tRNA synthetase